jgi:hypothetical protein
MMIVICYIGISNIFNIRELNIFENNINEHNIFKELPADKSKSKTESVTNTSSSSTNTSIKENGPVKVRIATAKRK